MYTTSRSAPTETCRFARMMASSAGEPFMKRGRRTVDELALIARRQGEDKVSIACKSGARFLIKTIEVLGSGNWRWLESIEGESHHEDDMPP